MRTPPSPLKLSCTAKTAKHTTSRNGQKALFLVYGGFVPKYKRYLNGSRTDYGGGYFHAIFKEVPAIRKLKKYKPTRFMAKGSHYDKDKADFAVSFI